MISIILPLYNKEKHIARTISSVLAQSFKSFELIIVNDGSTDKSISQVLKFQDDRIVIINKKNGGVSSARNTGITVAKYKYIAFLDADDVWDSNYLKKMGKLIKDYPNALVYASNFYFENSEIGVKEKANTDITRGIISNYFRIVLFKDLIHTSSVIIKKTILNGEIKFDERISRGEDISLWSKLATKGPIAYEPSGSNIYYLNTQNSMTKQSISPKRTWAYYVDKSNVSDIYQALYYKKIILARLFRYLIQERDFKNFSLLLSKQFKNIISLKPIF